VEVAFQATLDVPDMRPAAMDTDIADDIVHQESVWFNMLPQLPWSGQLVMALP